MLYKVINDVLVQVPSLYWSGGDLYNDGIFVMTIFDTSQIRIPCRVDSHEIWVLYIYGERVRWQFNSTMILSQEERKTWEAKGKSYSLQIRNLEN